MQSSARNSENKAPSLRRSSRNSNSLLSLQKSYMIIARANPVIMEPPKEDNDSEEEDLFSPPTEIKQTTSKLEELESRNTTSPEENLESPEFEENNGSLQEDPIDREKASNKLF